MSNGKQVTFVSSIHWHGGPAVWFRRLCGELPKYGWSCNLLLAGTPLLRPRDWDDWPSPVKIVRPAYSYASLVENVADAIISCDPDVVVGVALNVTPNAIRHLYRSGRSRARFIDTLVSDDNGEFERLRGHVDVITTVAAVSEACAERVRTGIPELASRVDRFWSPVPCPQQEPKRDNSSSVLRLVYLGRVFHASKRVLRLASLASALVRAKVDFTLTIVGDGPDRPALESSIAADPAARERVRFTGWLGNSEAMRLLSEQDVLLLVSDIEGQSVAMLEAMGNGVVPVVTDLPGQREVVADRKSGFLIPSAEMDGFVAVISKLAADRDLLSRMSQAAWNRIRNTYSMDAAVLQFAALLEDVSQRPLPNKDKVRQVSYPISRMGQLGVPHFVQGLKRWCFRQSVLW